MTAGVKSIRFDSASLTIGAALAGQGVALARLSLVADDLAGGRLISPFDQRFTVDGGYFLAHLEVIAEHPKIVAF